MSLYHGSESGRGALEEAWWEKEEDDKFPPDDMPLLAPYERTQPGFELLVASACERGADVDFPAVS